MNASYVTSWAFLCRYSLPPTLPQVFRQKDPFFLKILHEMREGRVSSEAEQVLADKVLYASCACVRVRHVLLRLRS